MPALLPEMGLQPLLVDCLEEWTPLGMEELLSAVRHFSISLSFKTMMFFTGDRVTLTSNS